MTALALAEILKLRAEVERLKKQRADHITYSPAAVGELRALLSRGLELFEFVEDDECIAWLADARAMLGEHDHDQS